MLINFVDATNDANHYTKPPPDDDDDDGDYGVLDCEEAYEQGILKHVDGFQSSFIKPRTSDEPFKACCYVHHNISKLTNLVFFTSSAVRRNVPVRPLSRM